MHTFLLYKNCMALPEADDFGAPGTAWNEFMPEADDFESYLSNGRWVGRTSETNTAYPFKPCEHPVRIVLAPICIIITAIGSGVQNAVILAIIRVLTIAIAERNVTALRC